MKKQYIALFECSYGDILAEEILNSSGVTIIAAYTPINQYIKEKLAGLGISHIWVFNASPDSSDSSCDIEYNRIKKSQEYNMSILKNTLNDMASGKKLDLDKINAISESIYLEIKDKSSIIKYLGEVKNTDEYTFCHCINVSLYSMLIAKWLKLSDTETKDIIKSGLLHDIGKIKIPPEILNKNSRLTHDEFEIMKKHTVYGYDISLTINELSKEVQKAILMHHEREDNSGYPHGVASKQISLYAKIIAIADVFDAMTSDRIYKKRATPFEAFEMFQTVGLRTFDTYVSSNFLKNISPYYIGSKVKLDNGFIGEIVYIPPHNISKPVIKVNSNFIDFNVNNVHKIECLL